MKKYTLPLGVFFILCFTSVCFSQWTQIGPSTATVNTLYISGDTIFGGNSLSGLVYSTDKGITWCQTDLNSAGTIAKSNNVLLVGGNSMYRSTDNGVNFTTSSFGSIFSVDIKNNAAIAGTVAGMYYSTNAGMNWSVSNLNSGIFRGAGINGNVFFAGSTSGVYKSINGGFSYTLVLSPRFVNSIFANDTAVYVCSNAGIDYTTNQGANWNQMPLAMNVRSLTINGTTLFATGIDYNSVLKSTNNGQNWTTVLTAAGFINTISAANNYIITSDNNASYVSTNNGTNWTEHKFHFMEAYAVMKTPTALYTSSTVNGAFRSTDNGANWPLVNPVSPFGHIRSFGIKDSKIFAGTNGAGVYVSTNDGLNWTQTSLNNKVVFSIYTSGSNIYAGTANSGIFLSTNDGVTWGLVSAPYTFYSITGNGNRLFAGAANNGLFYSDNSMNWFQTSLNWPNIGGVAAIGNYIFAGGTPGIYISSNNGANWSPSSFPYLHVNALVAVNNVVFAGCEKYGLFVSQDLGQTWRSINGNLGQRLSVSRLHVSGNDLYAATYYSSVVKAPISGLVGISTPIETEIPDKFSLSQNYPNPFNPTTQINYNLPVSDFLTLKIYDVIGNEVATLVNENKIAGSYNITFDAGKYNLSSGVYFYKLQAGEFSETKRMVLVK